MLLLFGTVIGDFALLADVGRRALLRLAGPGRAPALLAGHDGRGAMVALALCPVLPLCLLRRWPAPMTPWSKMCSLCAWMVYCPKKTHVLGCMRCACRT